MRPLAATLILISVACSSYRITPLATAARQGDTAAIDALVDAGADPDHPSGINGWTPLMHAIHKRQPHAVARLLERNASADAPARDGLTPS